MECIVCKKPLANTKNPLANTKNGKKPLANTKNPLANTKNGFLHTIHSILGGSVAEKVEKTKRKNKIK
jgi:hypothetical protein